jgi:uncharacterized repeat protein (TIGR03803 family)
MIGHTIGRQILRAGAIIAVCAGSGPAWSWQLQTLYRFCAAAHCSDGFSPVGRLVRDAAGVVYGVTGDGGAYSGGVVYSLAPDGEYQVLHAFTFSGDDGDYPAGGLASDAAGNLYGTTSTGGTDGIGTVFRIAPGGQEQLLYSFGGGQAGYDPSGDLLIDRSGNLFGTTISGGNFRFAGVVFELRHGSHERVLHEFCPTPSCLDGKSPGAGVIRDAAGNVYGTTAGGGVNHEGTLFVISPDGAESVLYSFCTAAGCTDGKQPQSDLILDEAGDLYGTTNGGGAKGAGTVFEVTAGGAETVLYSFCALPKCVDGVSPGAGVAMDDKGNLYGTTGAGGAYAGGTVFELTPGGSQSVLYSFCSAVKCADGQGPAAALIIDAAGNLYGTTENGGNGGAPGGGGGGTVFALRR